MSIRSAAVILASGGLMASATLSLAQPTINVIATNVPTATANAVAGIAGVAFAGTTTIGPFIRPTLSSDGRYLAFGATLLDSVGGVTSSTNRVVMLARYAGGPTPLAAPLPIARRGTSIGNINASTGELNTSFSDWVSVNTSGLVGISAIGNLSGTSLRVVLYYDSIAGTTRVVAREGAALTGVPGTWGTTMGALTLHNNGDFSIATQTTPPVNGLNTFKIVRASPVPATGLASAVTGYCINSNDPLGPTPWSPSGQLGATPNRPYSGFDVSKGRASTAVGSNSFISSAILGSLNGAGTGFTPDGVNGTVVVVNNVVKAQSGNPLPGSGFTSNVSSALTSGLNLDMGANGDWIAYGRSVSAAEHWVLTGAGLYAQPGTIIVPNVDPLQVVKYADNTPFTGVSTNCRGDSIVSGSIQTVLPTGPATIPGIVSSNRRVVLKQNDPVTIAIVDPITGPATATYYIASIVSDSIALDGDGWVTAAVSLSTSEFGGATQSALVRVRAFCRGDYSRDGNTSIDDIFIYLNGWFAGARNADQDCNGITNIDDIFIFLNDWFASGSCTL